LLPVVAVQSCTGAAGGGEGGACAPDARAPQHVVAAAEHVLSQVEAARGLGDAPLGHHVQLVEQVGVAVVQAHARGEGHGALQG